MEKEKYRLTKGIARAIIRSVFLYYLDTYQSAPAIQLESINNPKQLNKIPAQPTRLGVTLPKQKKIHTWLQNLQRDETNGKDNNGME